MIEEQPLQVDPSSSQNKKSQRDLEPFSKFRNCSRGISGSNGFGRLYSSHARKPPIGRGSRFSSNLPRQRSGDFLFY